MSIVNIKSEMLRNDKMVVPPVLGMSTFRVLFASYIGLKTANQMQSVMAGWLPSLIIGFAGIAFMFWYFATPVN